MNDTDGENVASAEAQAAYVAALKAHDFQFDYSDDIRVYRRGRDSLLALRDMQERLDPAFQIWNSIAPAQFQVHVIPGTEGTPS